MSKKVSRSKTNLQILEQPQTGSWLQIPDESTLPEQVQAIFKAQRERYGFVHPYFVGYSLNPDHLLCWFNYYDALQHGKGELSHRENHCSGSICNQSL